MAVSARDFIQLANLAAAAAMDPGRWQDFLDAMGQAVGTRVCTQLIGYDQVTKAAPLAFSSGYDPQILQLYETHFADSNPFAANFPNCGICDVITSEELCAPDVLKRTQFYADILLPLEDLCAGGGSMLVFDADRMVLIGGNMRAKDKENYEQEWLQLCARLAPVIRQSLEVNRMIMGLKFEKWAAERHMLGSGTAIIVVNSTMTIHYACPEAQALIAEGKLVGSDIAHRLKFRSEHAQAKLHSIVNAARRGAPDIAGSGIFGNAKILDEDGREWICRSMAMRIGDLDHSPFTAFLTGGGPAILVALKPLISRESFQEAVQEVLGLSPAEAMSVNLLADGLTPLKIAEEREVSIHTVRNQIKSALSKSGCRRQSELLQKVEQLRLHGS